MATMRIYLDTCCWNRLFDLPQTGRVRLESQAVTEIVARGESGAVTLIWSEVLDYEISNNPHREVATALALLSRICTERVPISQTSRNRAEILTQQGVGAFDALHIALAEESRCDIFLTVDDKLLRRMEHSTTTIQVISPLTLIMQSI